MSLWALHARRVETVTHGRSPRAPLGPTFNGGTGRTVGAKNKRGRFGEEEQGVWVPNNSGFRDSRARLASSSRKPLDNGKLRVLWSRSVRRVFGRSLPWIDADPASERSNRVIIAWHRRISLSSEVLAKMHPKTPVLKRVLFSMILPCRKRIRGHLLVVPPSMAARGVRWLGARHGKCT